MLVKLFWKEGCAKCVEAKKILKEIGIKTLEFNIDTVDGMAEACFHQVSKTPVLVLVDENDREIKVWESVLQAKKELSEITQEKK